MGATNDQEDPWPRFALTPAADIVGVNEIDTTALEGRAAQRASAWNARRSGAKTLWDVVEEIERLRDEYIVRLGFRLGLPLLVETTAPAHFSKQGISKR